jgi:hypothetical protein
MAYGNGGGMPTAPLSAAEASAAAAAAACGIPRHPLCALSRQMAEARPKVRWLPLRRPAGPGAGRGEYARASCEEGIALSPARYEIDDASSDEGMPGPGGPPYGLQGPDGAAEVVPVRVEVPEGGEAVFRLIVPSGAQIIVPLPDGTLAGDAVEFELQPHQLAALPRSDVVALIDGRFHAEAGEGE